MSALKFDLHSIYTKVIALLVVTTYILVPVYLFWHMEHMADSHMMSDQDCPYITGHNAVCPMDISEHLSTWQNIKVILPIIKFLTAHSNFLFVSLICLSLLVTQLVSYLQRQKYRHVQLLFTSLFSQGILNGKAY